MPDEVKFTQYKSEAQLRYGFRSNAGAPSSMALTQNDQLTLLSSGSDGLPIQFINHLIRQASIIGSRVQNSDSISKSIRDRGSNVSSGLVRGGPTEVVGLPLASSNRVAATDYGYTQLSDGSRVEHPLYNDMPYFMAIEKYFGGDHWQGGVAWRGPLPANFENNPDAIMAARMTKALIEAAFVSRNFHKECVNRHVYNIIGRPPIRTVVEVKPSNKASKQSKPAAATANEDVRPTMFPNPEEAVADSELVEAVDYAAREFWRLSSVHKQLRRATREACLYEIAFVRWFNSGAAVFQDDSAESVSEQGDQLLNSISSWRFHWVDPKKAKCAVIVDSADVPVFAYFEQRVVVGIYQEFQMLDVNGVTNLFFRTVADIEDTETMFELTQYNMGGQLLVHQMQRECLITPQFCQNNDMANVVYTITGRSNVQAGFLERVLLNAQLQGHYTDVRMADGSTVKQYVPNDMQSGHGSMLSVQGVPFIDPDTNAVTGMSNPQMLWKDPVSVKHFVDSKEIYLENIYAEIGQSGVRVINTALTSGYSKENSEGDNINFMQDTIDMVHGALHWFDKVFKRLLINHNPDIKLGRIVIETECATVDKMPTTEDKRVARELFDAGIWDLEVSQRETGIFNPTQRKRKLMEERSTGFGSNAFEQRRINAETAIMTSNVQLQAAEQRATQANSFSQTTNGSGKGGGAQNSAGVSAAVKDGPNPRKPVSPNTSTPNAGRRPAASNTDA